MRRAVRNHLGSHEVARVIYGAIIGLAVVVALEKHPPAAGVVAATLVGTAVAVALAELYSEILGTEVRTHQRIGRENLGHITHGAWAVTFGVGFPAIFFLLAAVDAFKLTTAFDLAKWTGLGLIAMYGYAAARLVGSRPAVALLHALAVGSIAGALIGLKALVH
jgi:hypothetical protein